MKKLYLLLVLATGAASAQVPNGSFEEFIGYGMETRYWGATPSLLQVIIDDENTPVSDYIILEEGVVARAFYSLESHTGDRAMEIRNAFNVTKNEVIPGKMILFNEDGGGITANGWNTGALIEEGTVIEGLGFYYKYFPLNPNEAAQAQLQTFDAGGTLLGSATIEIAGEESDYTYVATPLVAITEGIPAIVTVEFSMVTEHGSTTFGSHLLIDDVVTTNLALANPTFHTSTFMVTPTVTHNTLNITKGNDLPAGDYAFDIISMEGKVVQKATLSLTENGNSSVDVSALASGMYLIRTKDFSTKFIKE